MELFLAPSCVITAWLEAALPPPQRRPPPPDGTQNGLPLALQHHPTHLRLPRCLLVILRHHVYAVLPLLRLRPLLRIAAHRDRAALIRRQRRLLEIGGAGYIHFGQSHRQARQPGVGTGDKPPLGTDLDAP